MQDMVEVLQTMVHTAAASNGSISFDRSSIEHVGSLLQRASCASAGLAALRSQSDQLARVQADGYDKDNDLDTELAGSEEEAISDMERTPNAEVLDSAGAVNSPGQKVSQWERRLAACSAKLPAKQSSLQFRTAGVKKLSSKVVDPLRRHRGKGPLAAKGRAASDGEL